MGFLRSKKRTSSKPVDINLNDLPILPLQIKLLFKEKVYYDEEMVKFELMKICNDLNSKKEDIMHTYRLTDRLIEHKGERVPMLFKVIVPEVENNFIQIPDINLSQNWHWKEAKEGVKDVTYELMITDVAYDSMDYYTRLVGYNHFLLALVKALNPVAIFSLNSQKLVSAENIEKFLMGDESDPLHPHINIRLFRDRDCNHMETFGLSSLGLPEFQCRDKNIDVVQTAGVFWKYTHKQLEKGDFMLDDDTLTNYDNDLSYICKRKASLSNPKRVCWNLKKI